MSRNAIKPRLKLCLQTVCLKTAFDEIVLYLMCQGMVDI